jgi:hypothetical protein
MEWNEDQAAHLEWMDLSAFDFDRNNVEEINRQLAKTFQHFLGHYKFGKTIHGKSSIQEDEESIFRSPMD